MEAEETGRLEARGRPDKETLEVPVKTAALTRAEVEEVLARSEALELAEPREREATDLPIA